MKNLYININISELLKNKGVKKVITKQKKSANLIYKTEDYFTSSALPANYFKCAHYTKENIYVSAMQI